MTESELEAAQAREALLVVGLDPEVQDAREELISRGISARTRLIARGESGRPVSREDLADLLEVVRLEGTMFTVEHVSRRAVLKSETCADTPKSIAPLWRGIWAPGHGHAANALVAFREGLWVSERATNCEPGTPDSGWRLIVKRPK